MNPSSTPDTETRPAARTVAYAQEAITDPADPTRHMVAYVTEGEAGYQATTYTGTLDYCRDVAESINQARGHAPDDVLAIVASSFGAHNSELDEELDDTEEEQQGEEQRIREIQAQTLRAAARRHARTFGPGFEHQLTRAWLHDQADAIVAGQIGAES